MGLFRPKEEVPKAGQEAKVVQKPTERVVTLTERAITKIKELMEKDGKGGWGLRIEAIPGGCAGFMYNLEFEKQPREGDTVHEDGGLKVFIDSMSRDMLQGTTINYSEGLTGAGFIFNNPNARSTCGCGKSFG